MSIPDKDQKILWGRAANRCAFPACPKELVAEKTAFDPAVVLGEMAHIVGEQPTAPRGISPLTPKERNQYANLILLCEEHHTLVDGQPNTYTVDHLHQLKADHERWVRETLSPGEANLSAELPYVTDTLHSTLLPVNKIPYYVFQAPCELTENEVTKAIDWDAGRGEALVFIVRDKQLICFHDLRRPANPFHKIADRHFAKRRVAREWWDDTDLSRWYVTLLNRTLNKLTGWRGLHLDKDHNRYYFAPLERGKPRSVKYRPLNRDESSIFVVWQPISRGTGLPKKYWEHRAVSLRFHRVDDERWCLSLRPERRYTRDGYAELFRKAIGQRATSRKARMYNHEFLGEAVLWRDFLGGGKPRIILSFGKQKLIIDTTLIDTQVNWPGVPDDDKPFANVSHPDDLFTWAEFREALEESESEGDPEEEGHGNEDGDDS